MDPYGPIVSPSEFGTGSDINFDLKSEILIVTKAVIQIGTFKKKESRKIFGK